MAQSVTAYKDNSGKLHLTEEEADTTNAKELLLDSVISSNDARVSAHSVMEFIDLWPVATKEYLDEIIRIRGICP